MKSERTSGKSGTKSRERKNSPRSGGARNHVVDLWVVEAGSRGPFAEASRIPGYSREAIARLAGLTSTGSVTYQTGEAERLGRKTQLYVIGLEPDRSGGRTHIAAGRNFCSVPSRRLCSAFAAAWIVTAKRQPLTMCQCRRSRPLRVRPKTSLAWSQ